MLDQFKPKSSESSDLSHACEVLWHQHVRSDLIFSRRLILCKACCSFFYLTPESDHPKEYCVLSQHYLMENEVTSLEKMVDFFKPPPCLNVDQLGRSGAPGVIPSAEMPVPIFSFSHRTTALQAVLEGKEALQARAKPENRYLAEQSDHMKLQICDQKAEIEALRAENEELLIQLVRMKAQLRFEKRAVTRLANHILLFANEDCCCDDTGPEVHDKGLLK